jgi:N-acetylglucosamine-6-phosphate deacetylase
MWLNIDAVTHMYNVMPNATGHHGPGIFTDALMAERHLALG